jgi:tRNA(Ile)-lysidine synthase
MPSKTTMPLLSAQFPLALSSFLNARRWLVAYSGGIDSHVLLHWLCAIPNHPPIEVIHINHQLQSASGQWAAHCQHQAAQLDVPYHCVAVDIDQQVKGSLEEKARQARYQVFVSLLHAGDVLMQGHHLDDQVETLLLRLLRGSGSRGASAMPEQRSLGLGQLLRPLLHSCRADIEAYAARYNLHWVEDPSNQSLDFDRNFLRAQLLPVMSQRWPQYRQTLARAAGFNEESAELNNQLAALDFQRLNLSTVAASIPLPVLTELNSARKKNVLRYWLQNLGLPLPSAAQLQAVMEEVISAKQDAEPLVQWPGAQIRRFNDALYAMKPLNAVDQASQQWDITTAIEFPCGTLSANATVGVGLNSVKIKNKAITVRFRSGGERCQPLGRSGSQTLKKLFQEYGLEPWLRDRTPLIYCDDELIAAADLWVCEGWGVGADQQSVAIVWDK